METVYSIKEAAVILNLNYRTVLRLVHEGYINSIRVGRTHRISETSLNKFIHSADKQSVTYLLRK